MKMKAVIGIGFLVAAFGAAIGGGYISSEIKKNYKNTNYLMHVSDVSIVALDLNVANFQAQLELWEYSFLSSEKTPDEFLKYKDLLDFQTEIMDTLIKENTVYANTDPDEVSVAISEKIRMEEILRGIQDMKKFWNKILKMAKELKELEDDGLYSPEAKNHILYMEKFKEFRSEMSVMEDIFDDLDFNNTMDDFINEQRTLRLDLFHEVLAKGERLNLFVLFMAISFPVILGAGFLYMIFYKGE